MKFYVNVNTAQGGCGTQEKPFRSIQEAAQIAQPGDEILVAPGVYREYVDPIHAGTEEAPITYRSTEPLGAHITGAEPVKNWAFYQDNVGSAGSTTIFSATTTPTPPLYTVTGTSPKPTSTPAVCT